MLGIALDVGVLWGITSFLAKRNMSEDLLRFLLFAGVLLFTGIGLAVSGAPAPVAFSSWFGIVLLGMKFWIGATWLGAVIGAVLFLAYRMVLSMIL